MTRVIPDPATPATPGEVALERAELFRRLPPERIERLRPVLRERQLTRHRIVFREGQPAEFLWVLRSGAVRLTKTSPNGRVTTLEMLQAGELFGALDAGEIYPATAEATSAARAWCLPRRVVSGLVLEHPELALEILGIVSRRLREAHERLRSFAHDAVPKRLARVLLASARGGEARLTRRALAEAAGTTVETAIRVLRRFEREGLVAGEIGLVRVVDAAALRRLAGEL
jgi:CRP/FNR family transcriptional regulator